jgi:hypothetical protein
VDLIDADFGPTHGRKPGIHFALATAGQALASSPAADYIGADVYSNPSSAQATSSSSEYYLGDVRSEKFFYNHNDTYSALPSSDTATTYEYNIPGCGANQPDGSYVYPTNLQCIIVWNYADSTDGSDLYDFLESTLTDPHQIVMAFCNEPEIHQGSGGCMCDPSGTVEDCGGSSAFVSQFEVEASYIENFEAENDASNVHVAEDSWADYYNGSPPDCSFIVPSQYVNYYFVDVYRVCVRLVVVLDRGWLRA